MVASDPAAQSDIYSAVTLAGVVGTDCVILAGPRGQPIPADQETRLTAAAAGGYIVGGDTAVPPAKLDGRTMARLAGTDRWATARLVGQEAINTANNNPTPPTLQTAPNTAAEPDIVRDVIVSSAGARVACALNGDGDAKCIWFAVDPGPQMFDMPDGPYASIHPLDPARACGLRTDGTVACWGFTGDWVSIDEDRSRYEARLGNVKTPEGTFTAVHHSNWATVCGLRTDGTITCWGDNESSAVADTPSGAFTSLTVFLGDVCGLRPEGTVACSGDDGLPGWFGQDSAVRPPYIAFSSFSGLRACVLDAHGGFDCVDYNDYG